MLVTLQLVLRTKIDLSLWHTGGAGNAAIAEGLAWLAGRLDLPAEADSADPARRLHDTAYFNGKVYNVFPPLLGGLTVALSPLHRILGDSWTEDEPALSYVLLVFAPLPIVGYFVFLRRTGDAAWAAVLTVAWLGGTALLENLHAAQRGWLNQTYHAISQIGLLILAADILGKQRTWPGLIGLLIASYTRQLTFIYGFVLLWAAWRRGGMRRFAMCAVGLGLIAAPLLALNHLKFGSAWEFGYRYIYEGRETGDYVGERYAKHGLFSTSFFTENAYYMHVAPPRIEECSPAHLQLSETNPNGQSLWITTPLALFVLISIRQWWREPNARMLMAATLVVMFGLLCYHSPGFQQAGYSRFTLDFLPIWLVVIAPFTRNGWRTWFALACIAWSLLYGHLVVPDTSHAATATAVVALGQGTCG